MSKAVANEFLNKANNDPSIRNQIMILDAGSGFDALLDFAAYQGYFFSLEDLVAASKERYEQSMLSDDELFELEEFARAA